MSRATRLTPASFEGVQYWPGPPKHAASDSLPIRRLQCRLYPWQHARRRPSWFRYLIGQSLFSGATKIQASEFVKAGSWVNSSVMDLSRFIPFGWCGFLFSFFLFCFESDPIVFSFGLAGDQRADVAAHSLGPAHCFDKWDRAEMQMRFGRRARERLAMACRSVAAVLIGKTVSLPSVLLRLSCQSFIYLGSPPPPKKIFFKLV